ncbi:hypothetical protein ACFLVW_02080 [Chloroflexota bacterium]
MSIDWFRDLVISIFGVVATGVSIFIAVLAYSLYRRIKPVLKSLKKSAKTIQTLSSYTENEVVKPLIQMATVIQGVRQGINAVSKIFQKKKGGKDD